MTDWQSVGAKGVLLWENPNPTADFGRQDVYVTAGYETILVEYKYFKEDTITKYYVYHTISTAASYLSNGGTSRGIQYVPLNGRVIFGPATNDSSTINSAMIPTRIIGFKKNIADV